MNNGEQMQLPHSLYNYSTHNLYILLNKMWPREIIYYAGHVQKFNGKIFVFNCLGVKSHGFMRNEILSLIVELIGLFTLKINMHVYLFILSKKKKTLKIVQKKHGYT